MPLSLEAWNPDYALLQVEFDQGEPLEGVDTSIELPWKPLEPAKVPWPTLYLVDGRQRIDAILADERGHRALLVTVAAGALVRDQVSIRLFGEPWVRRILLRTAGFSAQEFALGSMNYRAKEVEAGDLRTLVQTVNPLMRALEAELATTLPGALVILDGPIYAPEGRAPGARVMGYAKTMWQRYLPKDQESILSELRPATRTPLFFIPKSARRKLDLFSWYLRLPLEPSLPFHSAASLLRAEVVAGDIESARKLADLSVDIFATMASSPVRDPRAPQNLVPVGGLEALIGRHMGQKELVRRKIVQALSGGAT